MPVQLELPVHTGSGSMALPVPVAVVRAGNQPTGTGRLQVILFRLTALRLVLVLTVTSAVRVALLPNAGAA